MITVDGVTKTYGGHLAVDDVSFVARPGRVTGFLGPNGAGKSTTMRIMVGLTPASRGHVTDRRPPLRRHPEPGPARRRAARRLGAARRPHRPRGAHHRRRDDGPAAAPGRRDARAGVALTDRGQAPRPELLARHAAAPRHRARAARRPADPGPRRAGQRARPGRHPLDARPAQGVRRAGRHRAALVPPAPRGGEDRRRADPHRARPDRRAGHQGRAAADPRRLREGRRARDACSTRSPPRASHAVPSGDGLRSDAETVQIGKVAAAHGITLVELRPAEGAGLEDLFLQLTADTQRDDLGDTTPEGAHA